MRPNALPEIESAPQLFGKDLLEQRKLIEKYAVAAVRKHPEAGVRNGALLNAGQLRRNDPVFSSMENRGWNPHRLQILSSVLVPQGKGGLHRGDAGGAQGDLLDPPKGCSAFGRGEQLP